MLREVVLDTETTGIDAKAGDRIIEIGCVEIVNHVQTGQSFHRQINPMRAVSQGAFAVHGISDAMLADKPVFAEIVNDFVAFCGASRLVIHNAPFDVGFLNAEFARLGTAAPTPIALADVIDTLQLARRKHLGASNSLDALCLRYGIDTTRRVKHGALLDAQILADVYVELLGGKQTTLGLSAGDHSPTIGSSRNEEADRVLFEGRVLKTRLTAHERQRHADFIDTLGQATIWKDFFGQKNCD